MKIPPRDNLSPDSQGWRRWVNDGIMDLNTRLSVLSNNVTNLGKALGGNLRVLGSQIKRLEESITHTDITYTAPGGNPFYTTLEMSEIVKPSWGWSDALIFASVKEYEVPPFSTDTSIFVLSSSPNVYSTDFLVAEYTPVTVSTRTTAVIPFNDSDLPLSVTVSPTGTGEVTVTIRLTAIWS